MLSTEGNTYYFSGHLGIRMPYHARSPQEAHKEINLLYEKGTIHKEEKDRLLSWCRKHPPGCETGGTTNIAYSSSMHEVSARRRLKNIRWY